MAVPEFDPVLAGEEIAQFIRKQAAAAKSRGVVVGVSGGLDSAVVVFCARGR